MKSKISSRWASAALASLALAALLAACGSSSNTSTSTSASTGSRTSRTALQACLKKHGVNIPTRLSRSGAPPAGAPGGGSGAPTGGGPPSGGFPAGGFPGGGGFRGGANSSKFRAAFKACGANFPAAGRFRGRRPTFSHAAIDKYVACVRKHGYDLPTPNFSGKGSVFPSKVESNAKFQSASRACQSLLRPAAGGGTGSSA